MTSSFYPNRDAFLATGITSIVAKSILTHENCSTCLGKFANKNFTPTVYQYQRRSKPRIASTPQLAGLGEQAARIRSCSHTLR